MSVQEFSSLNKSAKDQTRPALSDNSLTDINLPQPASDSAAYLFMADMNGRAPLPGLISIISDLDTDTRKIVRKINYINEAVEDYKFFLRSQTSALQAELGTANNGRMQMSDYELENIAAKITHTKIRADLNDILDRLPEQERRAILSISKPDNFIHLLKAIGFSMEKRYVGKSLCEQCSLIQEALTLHTLCKLNAHNINLVGKS